MSHPQLSVLAVIALIGGIATPYGILFTACSSDSRPDAGRTDAALVGTDTDPADAATSDLRSAPFDGGRIVLHDAGAPPSCATTCDCPQGLGCFEGTCRATGFPIYCCGRPGCPSGQECLDEQESPGLCSGAPDAGADAGSPDQGPGRIGAACTSDPGCDQAQGLTCWEEAQFQILYDGYCVLDGCAPSCPAESTCITVGSNSGCMQNCVTNDDCRSGAFCYQLPSSAIRICLPKCQDDVLAMLVCDRPLNGTYYCNHTSGECEPTPAQTPGAAIGAPCVDNTHCGPGHVCLGERAWDLPGGMCTKACSGVPEAVSCAAAETCQNIGIGVCTKDCVAGACPERASATCTTPPTWQSLGCFPQ